jgi:Flp pilus assembly protein TadG
VKGLARKFTRSRSGVAAIEFALIYPVLLLLMVGMFEITNAVIAYQKTQKLAYTVDQLITKAPSVTAQIVQKTMSAAVSVLAPLDGTNATIDVTYRYIGADGKISTSWTQNFPSGKKGSVLNSQLPDNYSALRDVGYLTTSVRYNHSATFPALFFKQLQMNAESIVRPRPGKPITCTDC